MASTEPSPRPHDSSSEGSGSSTAILVILGCGGLLLVAVVVLVVGGFFLFKSSSKSQTAVSQKPARYETTVTDGDTVTYHGTDGKTLTVTKDGDNRTVKFQAGDGSFKVETGTASALPAWLPLYTGATPKWQTQTKTPKGNQTVVSFVTPNAPTQISGFYESKLKALGFTLQTRQQGGSMFQTLIMKHSDGRNVSVTSIQKGQETNVILQVLTPSK